MTTTAPSTTDATDHRSLLPWAVAAWLLGVVLTAVGTFADLTGNDDGGSDDELTQWLVLITVLGLVVFVVYRFWFEPAAAAAVAPNSALIAGALSLLLIPAFWTGVPGVFAIGALVLGRRGGGPKAVVGMVLGALGLAAAVLLAVSG